jgi:TonB family protein
MNEAMLYRPNNRKSIWFSLVCALTIHIALVALAENKSKPVVSGSTPEGADIIGIDNPTADPIVMDVSPPEQPPIPDDQEFHDENVAQRIYPRKKISPAPVRSNSAGATNGMRGSAKALALYAPRPAYPYEARRAGITGSGIAQLIVDPASGNVTDARMSQSTGNPVLDNATLSAFRRWRFKAGMAENIAVPITYTLTGVSY